MKTTQNRTADRTPLSSIPAVAIVGRPNVGKSTLFNRLLGRRRAIVGDEPGITRDRIYGEAEWRGRRLRVIDTGGIIPEEKEAIPAAILAQAKVALDEAAAIVMVVDARSELAAPDMELARLLQRTGKPLFLAVNKVETANLEAVAQEFHRLGIGELYPVSAEHGDGVAELLDAILTVLPEHLSEEEAEQEKEEKIEEREVKVAIIGRPNVGKSTLLNRLTGTGRAIVSPIPGTTRDAIDELVERDGMRLRFIDTAGIRRKGKTKLMAEKLSVVMARKHLESADIALILIDATEGVTALDATIAGYAHESGRSTIIVVNKWDLAVSHPVAPTSGATRVGQPENPHPGARAALGWSTQGLKWGTQVSRNRYEQRVRDALKFLDYTPVVFVSALSGKNVDKIFRQIELVACERRKRISTSEMNRFLKTVDFDRAPVPISRRVKIYYLTQASTAPPSFILFTDREVKLHFSYQRFLENQIRRAFGFLGTPIRIRSRASR